MFLGKNPKNTEMFWDKNPKNTEMFWDNKLARCGAMRLYWWLYKDVGEQQPIKKQGIETLPRAYIIKV